MRSTGEIKMNVTFGIAAETMSDVVKHQAAEWINLSETFRAENPSSEKDTLISEAQDLHKEATEKLVKAIGL